MHKAVFVTRIVTTFVATVAVSTGEVNATAVVRGVPWIVIPVVSKVTVPPTFLYATSYVAVAVSPTAIPAPIVVARETHLMVIKPPVALTVV